MFEKYSNKYLTEKLNKREQNLADLLADDVSDYLGDTMDFDEFSSMDQEEKEDVVNNALGKLSDKYYNDGDFDKDLDKLMNRKYKEVTSYIASQLSEGIEMIEEAKDNLYLQLHKKYAEQIKGLKAKKIKKLTDLVSVQRWSMEDRDDYFDMDPKKKKELSAEYDNERKLFKKYMARDYSVMLPKGTESLPESEVNEARGAKSTQFTKPGKDGDIYFSKREGNAVAVRQGDLLQSIYVYDGEVKLGKVQKTDKRWENMGEPSEKLLIDLKLKNVGGLNTKETQTEDGKLIYAFLSESINEANDPVYKKGQKINYQLYFQGGVGKYADAISKSKDVDTGVIRKRTKNKITGSFKYELTNGLELSADEIVGLAESVNESQKRKKPISYLPQSFKVLKEFKLDGERLDKGYWTKQLGDEYVNKGTKQSRNFSIEDFQYLEKHLHREVWITYNPDDYNESVDVDTFVNEAKAVNKDAIENMDKGNFPQELKDIIPLVSTKDMEAFLKRTKIGFWEISNGRFRFPVKDKKQWHILKMMSHKFADKQYFQLTESVNEAKSKYQGDPQLFKGDTVKLLQDEWEVIETDYKPNKAFKDPFTFTGTDYKQSRDVTKITNKNAIGYKVRTVEPKGYTPQYGFLYQYIGSINGELYTKLAIKGVPQNESVNELRNNGLLSDVDNIDQILMNTKNRRAARDWEEYTEDLFADYDGEVWQVDFRINSPGGITWADIEDSDIKAAIDVGQDIMNRYKIKESVNEGKDEDYLKTLADSDYFAKGHETLWGLQSSIKRILGNREISPDESDVLDAINWLKDGLGNGDPRKTSLGKKLLKMKWVTESVNEGQFSWMTHDSDAQIGSEMVNRIEVYMFDNEGNKWKENRYEGYGEFGGKDYYDLLATMNGYTEEDLKDKKLLKKIRVMGKPEMRQIGIALAFDDLKPKNGKKVLYPALVTDPRYNWKRHNFEEEADSDPNQSWAVEDDYDDDDWGYDESVEESWMLPRFEGFVNENENRVYGMFTDDQGKPTKLDKELLDIALKGLPSKIVKNIDAVEANGYGKSSAISPPTVSNKGQSRGEIEYHKIGIGLLKPMGRNKITAITLGLRKRTSGPGTGYLYMKVAPDWRHNLGPDAKGAIEFWDDPASFLKKLYDEKFSNWF